MYWQTANVDIFEEVSGTSCARHAPPRVFRVASSLCPELSCVHAQSWLWDLAARTSNSSISILHTSARGGNFPKTSYRNFLASPPPPNCFTELFNRRRNWSRSALPLQHCTCVRVHSAGLLLFFVKKSHNEERKVLSTSLFIRYTLRDCFARCSSEARVLLLKKIQFVRSERLEEAKPIRRVSMRKPDLRIEEISWLDFVFSLTFFSIAQEVSDEDVRCVHCMHVGGGFGVGSSWSEGKEL